MERDSLIAHGVSYILHDRLLNCSDYSEGLVCTKCGSILSVYESVSISKNNTGNFVDEELLANQGGEKYLVKREPYCRVCKDTKCAKVIMPFVLRYLCNELAGMNIKMLFKVS